MAEIIGLVASGMTLAGLFKTCIEAFDLIQTCRHQELDLKKLTLRLNIEKCRLYTWGQAMGLTESTNEDQQCPLHMYQFHELVTESLEIIFQLFNDTHKIKDAYGCRPFMGQDGSPVRLAEVEEARPVRDLATSFDNFKIGGNKRNCPSGIVQKARWAVHDRKKFNGLITEVKDLIDGLQHITKSLATMAEQGRMMSKGISNITDIGTLSLVAEVCEVDHPDLSDAASMRADTISMATTTRNCIENWTDSIDAGTAFDSAPSDLESLTVTELKHWLWQFLQDPKTAISNVPPSKNIATDTGDEELTDRSCEDTGLASIDLVENERRRANVSEAYRARYPVRTSVRYRQSVLLFILTMAIFAPTSFTTATFGMNYNELNGQSNSRRWFAYLPLFLTSLALTTVAVMLAFYWKRFYVRTSEFMGLDK
jgi:hypothetical protein